MSEIRQNLLTGEWVIIAPERAKRPADLLAKKEKPAIPAFAANCPFCPGNEQLTADARFVKTGADGRWLIRSVVNKFSALSPTVDVGFQKHPFGESLNGFGFHEVIIESPEHHQTMALLPQDHVREILATYRQRFLELSSDKRIRHVLLFKNHGEEAGASLQHSHSQIVGLPIIPGQIVDRIERARRFHADRQTCLGCWMVTQERQDGARLVAENEQFVAFIPFAGLSPFHLWIFPKTHSACFAELSEEGLSAFAQILKGILGKLYHGLQNPAFNLVVRSLAPRDSASPFFHWYLSIVPRIGKAAGFELGTGMYINSSSPEKSAQLLREAPAVAVPTEQAPG